MRKPEDFYKSQELFSKWRRGIYKNAQCAYQLYGEHVLIEKWMVSGPDEIHAIMVEIFPDGDGFYLYGRKEK